MAEGLADDGPNERVSLSDNGEASYCPHFERSSCVIHFSCCVDGRFFPCHKCHNEAIEKEIEAALLNERSTEDRDGVGNDDDGQGTSRAEGSDLDASHSPETSLTDEEHMQVTPPPRLPVETASQASVSNPVTMDENLENSRDTENAGAAEASSMQAQARAVNKLLAIYNAQHPDAKGKDADRLKCTKCRHEQGISSTCEKCNHEFAKYFCPECRIYVNGSMEPFHCAKCGVCRGGGRDNYFHCDVCNICLAVTLKDKHKCTENSGNDLCGICFEELFSGYILLPCGHKLHRKCIEKLVCRGSLDCPFCRRPIFQDEEETVEKVAVWSQACRWVRRHLGCLADRMLQVNSPNYIV